MSSVKNSLEGFGCFFKGLLETYGAGCFFKGLLETYGAGAI